MEHSPTQEYALDQSHEMIQHLASLLPVVDLSEWAENGSDLLSHGLIDDQRTSDAIEKILRTLYVPGKHVLITGDKGVGKTSLIRSLVLKNSQGVSPFLKDMRFLWVDCNNVGPEDSRACLETIFSIVSKLDRLVLCLDGISALLRRSHGGSNKPLMRSMISRPNLRVIGVMSSWEFNDLISSDAQMLESFARVNLEEPSEEFAKIVAERQVDILKSLYGFNIHEDVAERVVALTSTFILNECHPAKSVNLLKQICANADFDRTQLNLSHEEVRKEDVVVAISEKTGIPPETVSGDSPSDGFEEPLLDAVVGQDESVQMAANELNLIKAGLNEPGKPASVLLFAGMTGVGKTELAKRIAELYSSSRRLQVYAMGNYTEPHSVSGIIGVPPGYVGHEEGGRLVNELNSDPYSVFLLDEAEKCHPNIWKPFLNLFDEGWLVDQRGQKAYADRAIFILTTNAGDRQISQMAKSGTPTEEIAERVKQVLSKVRHERSSQPVFPPQFLSRIKRIMIFNPLDEDAMTGVSECRLQSMSKLWLIKRQKQIEWEPEVARFIGQKGHQQNEASNGREGGRIISRLISDYVESKIQEQAQRDPDAYSAAQVIRIRVDGDLNDVENVSLRIQFEPSII
ncbi:AAA family ATPase [Gimesia chilikensis]|uniref:ATP-dependent Clp protease ATP-binding subunit ClpE n=1 Tax=Gimesia chilikensis TaxID=2605989 RepID=A0A517PW93_9PLAN|nr:AAA family ATPase [Gimesia chilikensis]QDT23649.1 ATP-dependent Clp protease ATP-binding subunit ClpE [Gimesia chilikensis]